MPADFFYYHNLLAIIVAHTGIKRYSHPLLTIGAREIQMEIHQLIQNLHINIWCSNSFGACLCNQLSTFHFTSSEPMKATTRARITAQVKIIILTIAILVFVNYRRGYLTKFVIHKTSFYTQCAKGVYQTLILGFVKSKSTIDIWALLIYPINPNPSVHTEIGGVNLFDYLLF